MKQQRIFKQVFYTVGPIILSLVITAVLIMAVGADPREVLESTWEGVFRNSKSFAGAVNFWIPLALASIGLVVTFRAGLWNIGIEGQMMVGAIFASWAALFIRLLPPAPVISPLTPFDADFALALMGRAAYLSTDVISVLHVLLQLGLAMLGGMLWALLVGVLKVKLGIHEIFGGVALNALANVWTIFLISGPWAPPSGGTAQATDPFPPITLLPEYSPDFPVNLLLLIIVFVASVGIWLALRGTRWGLQLKATGHNPRSALLLGVPTDRVALSAFVVCGALAGLGGAYRVLFTFDSLRPLASGGIGFLGLLVVLLVQFRPLWVPLISFAFAAILAGSTRLKIKLDLDSSLAGVLQGILVLTVLLFSGLGGESEELAPDMTGDEAQTPPSETAS